jgi:hypothetical protein
VDDVSSPHGVSNNLNNINGLGFYYVIRGHLENVGVLIRLNREDWYRLHDFANRQGISLQKLVVASLTDYMQSKGVRPITGK